MFSPTREVGEQIQLLVDDADAGALRVERAGDGGGPAVDADDAAIGPHRSGDDLGQRALARAVLAHQRVDFAGLQRESGFAEGVNAAVMFADLFSFQKVGQLFKVSR